MPPSPRSSKNPPPMPSALERDPRWHLAARIAASPQLSRSDQLREILFYLIRQSLLHPDEPIRESEIAHKALGRPASFNPVDDNIVRVQVAHLRKRLLQYFNEKGQDEKLQVTIARGSYRPVFTPRPRFGAEEELPLPAAPVAETELAAVQPAPPPADLPQPATETWQSITISRARWRALLAAAAVLLLAVFYFAFNDIRNIRRIASLQNALAPWQAQPALKTFWGAFFSSGHETDLVVSDNSLLLNEQITQFSPTYSAYINHDFPSEQQKNSFSPEMRKAINVIASKGLGSISEFKAVQKILDLSPHNGRLRLFGARQFPPAFLEQNNVILIGGLIANPWEGLYDDKLNFGQITRFVDTGSTWVENRHPQPGEPKSYSTDDNVGYCDIAFLPQTAHGTSVLIVEGTGSEATEAAGDFLNSEEQMSGLLRRFHTQSFPAFEVLLKINQLRGTPLTASIEAFRILPQMH